ncbi:MAG: hypothetical protein ACKOJI_10740, partial [Phycisphaerales bacterium]
MWQIGAQFPGEFAAIAPSAGWVSFQSYVGATAGGAAGRRGPAVEMLTLAASPSNTLGRKENWRDQGVYVLHGDADDNVPVTEARSMFKQMAALPHPDFEYFEKPGAGHWWGNECVDWPPMMGFLFRHVLPDPATVDRVRFRTASPQVSHRRDWVRIQQQEVPFVVSSVDARLDRATRTVTVATKNVAMLDLLPPGAAPAVGAATVAFVLDGERLELPQSGARMHARFERRMTPEGAVRWIAHSKAEGTDHPAAGRLLLGVLHRGGAFKNAFAHGFVAVVGTQGDDQQDALILAKARSVMISKRPLPRTHHWSASWRAFAMISASCWSSPCVPTTATNPCAKAFLNAPPRAGFFSVCFTAPGWSAPSAFECAIQRTAPSGVMRRSKRACMR